MKITNLGQNNVPYKLGNIIYHFERYLNEYPTEYENIIVSRYKRIISESGLEGLITLETPEKLLKSVLDNIFNYEMWTEISASMDYTKSERNMLGTFFSGFMASYQNQSEDYALFLEELLQENLDDLVIEEDDEKTIEVGSIIGGLECIVGMNVRFDDTNERGFLVKNSGYIQEIGNNGKQTYLLINGDNGLEKFSTNQNFEVLEIPNQSKNGLDVEKIIDIADKFLAAEDSNHIGNYHAALANTYDEAGQYVYDIMITLDKSAKILGYSEKEKIDLIKWGVTGVVIDRLFTDSEDDLWDTPAYNTSKEAFIENFKGWVKEGFYDFDFNAVDLLETIYEIDSVDDKNYVVNDVKIIEEKLITSTSDDNFIEGICNFYANSDSILYTCEFKVYEEDGIQIVSILDDKNKIVSKFDLNLDILEKAISDEVDMDLFNEFIITDFRIDSQSLYNNTETIRGNFSCKIGGKNASGEFGAWKDSGETEIQVEVPQIDAVYQQEYDKFGDFSVELDEFIRDNVDQDLWETEIIEVSDELIEEWLTNDIATDYQLEVGSENYTGFLNTGGDNIDEPGRTYCKEITKDYDKWNNFCSQNLNISFTFNVDGEEVIFENNIAEESHDFVINDFRIMNQSYDESNGHITGIFKVTVDGNEAIGEFGAWQDVNEWDDISVEVNQIDVVAYQQEYNKFESFSIELDEFIRDNVDRDLWETDNSNNENARKETLSLLQNKIRENSDKKIYLWESNLSTKVKNKLYLIKNADNIYDIQLPNEVYGEEYDGFTVGYVLFLIDFNSSGNTKFEIYEVHIGNVDGSSDFEVTEWDKSVYEYENNNFIEIEGYTDERADLNDNDSWGIAEELRDIITNGNTISNDFIQFEVTNQYFDKGVDNATDCVQGSFSFLDENFVIKGEFKYYNDGTIEVFDFLDENEDDVTYTNEQVESIETLLVESGTINTSILFNSNGPNKQQEIEWYVNELQNNSDFPNPKVNIIYPYLNIEADVIVSIDKVKEFFTEIENIELDSFDSFETVYGYDSNSRMPDYVDFVSFMNKVREVVTGDSKPVEAMYNVYLNFPINGKVLIIKMIVNADSHDLVESIFG